jgi:hypothetical protein
VTGGKGAGRLQEELFAAAACRASAEPVLMALRPEFYELIWRGLKRHEFRRRFVEGRPVRWFVYLNAPVSRLAAVIGLGPAVVDVPERIAAIAEAARPGNGASVLVSWPEAGCPGDGGGIRYHAARTVTAMQIRCSARVHGGSQEPGRKQVPAGALAAIRLLAGQGSGLAAAPGTRPGCCHRPPDPGPRLAGDRPAGTFR